MMKPKKTKIETILIITLAAVLIPFDVSLATGGGGGVVGFKPLSKFDYDGNFSYHKVRIK